MQLSTIMTHAPRTVLPETRLEEATAVMDQLQIRHLPVCDAAGNIVGVVSDRDLLHVPARPAHDERGDAPRRRCSTIADVMSRDPVTAAPQDCVVQAPIELVGRSIGCLPIVRDGVLVGIVTAVDVMRAYLRRVDAASIDAGDNPPIQRLMSAHPATCTPRTTLAEARRTMHVDGLRHLPVLDCGSLVGMLSDRDLRRAYGAGRAKDTAVEEVMSSEVVTLSVEATAYDAARTLLTHRISAVPIVSGAERSRGIVGIATVTDLLDHCLTALRDDGRMRSTR
jgi:CBS domain-containing protein